MLTKSNTIIDKHYRNYCQKKIQFNNEEMLPLGFTKVVMVRKYWKKSEHDKMVHYALDSKILEGTKSYTVKASQIILIEPRDK